MTGPAGIEGHNTVHMGAQRRSEVSAWRLQPQTSAYADQRDVRQSTRANLVEDGAAAFRPKLCFLTQLANLKRNRAIGANGVWHEIGENDFEPIDRCHAKQCITLIDQVQYGPHDNSNEK